MCLSDFCSVLFPLGNKFAKVLEQEVIERDLGTTVTIKGKKVHKENLRVLFYFCCCRIILVCLPWVSAKIMDYSGAHFIAVTDSDVATFTDLDYLAQRMNLSKHESIIR